MRSHLIILALLLTSLWACHSVQKPQGRSAGVESSRFKDCPFSINGDYEDALVQNLVQNDAN